MSDNILEIGYKLSDDCGLPRYTNLVGNQEQNARKILTSIKDGLFIDAFIDRDWEMLKQPFEIDVYYAEARPTYALPTDFSRIVNDTIWDETNYNRVRGPVDLREWQEFQKGLAQLAGLEVVCRISGDLTNNVKVIEFYPDTTIATISFYYVSTKCVMAAGGPAKVAITADTDTTVIPDNVVRTAAKWRLLRSLGMNFQDERLEYAALLDDMSANDSGGKKIHMARSLRYDIANVPEVGFG